MLLSCVESSRPCACRSWKVVIFLVLPGAQLGWLLLIQVWILLLWCSRTRSPFTRRLDQLLALLVPETERTRNRLTSAHGQRALQALSGSGTLGGLRGSARRWRAQLRGVYAHGYQVASETISSPRDVARGRELVREAVDALEEERARGGAKTSSTEDPVVVLAYGLGAWPSGANLTSLEQLLGQLGVSQRELRNRFEGLVRTVATANRNREFRELAGASFVLGAAARIVEAAVAPGRSVPPPGWLATIKAHLR